VTKDDLRMMSNASTSQHAISLLLLLLVLSNKANVFRVWRGKRRKRNKFACAKLNSKNILCATRTDLTDTP